MVIVEGLDVSRFQVSLRGHKQSAGNVESWFRESPLYSSGAEIIPNRSMLRRVDQDVPKSRVGWHMDANLVGYRGEVWTAWIPLVEIDDETPGLEFADHGLTDRDAAERWRVAEKRSGQVDDDGLRSIVGDYRVVTPRLSVGSALVFNQFEIHRTEAMRRHKPRLSLDVRFKGAR